MTTRREWVWAWLSHRGDPTSESNVVAVLTWIRSEFGGAAPIPAAWNPMATTRRAHGTTDYNSVGVKNYPDEATGIAALSDTLNLTEPGYAAIRSALEHGQDSEAVIDAVHASVWGSKPTRDEYAFVLTHLEAESALEVHGADEGHAEPPHGDFPPFPGVLLRDRTDGHGTALWQAQMRHRGWSITVDDQYGWRSAHVCRAFQAEKGLDADGIVGPITWAAAWTAPIT